MATRQSPRSKRKPGQAPTAEEAPQERVDTDDEVETDRKTPKNSDAEVANNCDVYALNGSSCRLYKSIVKHMKTSEHAANFVLSPVAIFNSLHLPYQLTKGKTKEELENSFFGFAEQLDAKSGVAAHSKSEGLQANVEQVQSMIQAGGKPAVAKKQQASAAYRLIAVNKLVLGSGTDVAQRHQDVYQVDLSDKERARDTINQQLEGKTEQRIAGLVKSDNVPGKNSGLLVSAAHFSADWESKFLEKSRTVYQKPNRGVLDGLPMSMEDFHNLDGSVRKVLMVHLEEKIFLTRDEDLKVTMFELPFSQYSMNLIIVMPDDTSSEGVRRFEENFTHQTFELLQKNAQMPLTRVYLPKFNVEHHMSLTKGLQDVGVKHLFDSGNIFSSNTDWTDFSSQGDAVTHVSEVLHGASFSVSGECGQRKGQKRKNDGNSAGDNNSPECIQLEGARFANGVHVDRPFFFVVQSSWPNIWSVMGHIQHLEEADSAVWRHLSAP